MARFEMRVDDDLLRRVDEARGSYPRATWIKRALESALSGEPAIAPGGPRSQGEAASSRAPLSEVDRAKERVKEMREGFMCPGGCEGVYGSPAASCRVCGRKTTKEAK